MSDILSSLAYLTGKPVASAKIKAQPEHFQVREDLGFAFTGEGEHLMVRIRKTGENTSFVANELAKACGVKSKDVSWAGLKDRHAVTEQWLSVHLPKGETPDFSTFLAQYPSIEILATDRHNKKLRPGDLIGNEFVVTLSEVTDMADVEQRLEKVNKLVCQTTLVANALVTMEITSTKPVVGDEKTFVRVTKTNAACTCLPRVHGSSTASFLLV